MHRYTRDPLGPRLVLAHDRLLLQVVLEDSCLSGGEKVGLRRVEGDALDYAIGRREWLLGGCLTYGVDEDL